ncbi:MAG: hypothetical protein JWQ74_2317 [Marmoricola sp.]|nr:hypothetical protein [Marmoricola sp.]
MRRLLLVLAVAAGMLVLTPGTSWACSCVQSSVAQHVKNAGTVVDATVQWVSSNGIETTYSVEVAGQYKGKAAQREKLVGPASEAACGLGDLAAGERYLFFVKGRHPGQMKVDACGGSLPYDATTAAQVAAVTGPATGPYVSPPVRPGAVDEDPIAGTSVWSILGTSAIIAFVIGGLIWIRRKA